MSPRKYRQRGYMDEERDGGDRRGPAGPRPEPGREREGPRGRGLGAPTAELFRCAVCGREAAPPAAGEHAAVCASCGADLHTCTHCRHFDTSAPRECRQAIPERITAKSRRNECQLFEPRVTVEQGSDSGRPADPKAAFDALFKL